MGELTHVARVGTSWPKLEESPLMKRLKADGYNEEMLAEDLERWGLDLLPEDKPEEGYTDAQQWYAMTMRYADWYGGETNEEKDRSLAGQRQRNARQAPTFDLLEELETDDRLMLLADFMRRIGVGEEHEGVVISGPPGTYKTFLCKATKAEAREVGRRCVVYDTKKLIEDVQATYSSSGADAGTKREILARVVENDIVCLDDLGRERTTSEDANRIVTDLIDEIYRRMDSITLIVTTNMPLEKLPEVYEPAMVSRLREMCRQITLTIPDSRKGKEW